MNTSTLYTVLLMGVPFVAGLTVYGLLRNRNRGAFGAGCAAIVTGVLLSFAITGVFILLTLN